MQEDTPACVLHACGQPHLSGPYDYLGHPDYHRAREHLLCGMGPRLLRRVSPRQSDPPVERILHPPVHYDDYYFELEGGGYDVIAAVLFTPVPLLC